MNFCWVGLGQPPFHVFYFWSVSLFSAPEGNRGFHPLWGPSPTSPCQFPWHQPDFQHRQGRAGRAGVGPGGQRHSGSRGGSKPGHREPSAALLTLPPALTLTGRGGSPQLRLCHRYRVGRDGADRPSCWKHLRHPQGHKPTYHWPGWRWRWGWGCSLIAGVRVAVHHTLQWASLLVFAPPGEAFVLCNPHRGTIQLGGETSDWPFLLMLSFWAGCWAAGLLGHVQVSDVDWRSLSAGRAHCNRTWILLTQPGCPGSICHVEREGGSAFTHHWCHPSSHTRPARSSVPQPDLQPRSILLLLTATLSMLLQLLFTGSYLAPPQTFPCRTF